MLRKKLRNKIRLIILLCLMIFMVGCGNSKAEEYRQIQVYKTEGTVSIERQGSSMEAYDSMQLQSGDSIETAADSFVQLKLDEDKYILVESDSKISLQASGNEVDSKTSIYLEKGAIVNRLENALSEDSSYEVTTPNSTMAVRGTTFRVALSLDEKGDTHAAIAVYGGKVECKLVFPDGTEGKAVTIETGTEVLVFGNDETSEFVGTNNVNYEELELEVIEFLEIAIEKGEELSITKEEMQVIKEILKDKMEAKKSEGEGVEKELLENEKDMIEETKMNQSPDTIIDSMEKEANAEEDKSIQEKVNTENKESQEMTEGTETNGEVDEDTSADDSGNAGGSGGSGNGGSSGGSGGSGDSGGNETPEVTERTINVIFYCNGSVYATTEQIVDSTSNSVNVNKPTLKPFAGVTGWEIEASEQFWIEGYDENNVNYPIVFQEGSTETISFQAGTEPLTISFKCNTTE